MLLKLQDGGRPPSWKSKNRIIVITGIIDHRQIWLDDAFWPFPPYRPLFCIPRKSYRISHIILPDHNRKEPKENIYSNIVFGNSNVLLVSSLTKSVHNGGFCGSGWHFVLLIRLARELTYWSVVTFIEWSTRLMPRVHWFTAKWPSLWSPYVIGQTIIFLPCDFYLSSSFFFPCLISSAVSTMLPHMVWP